MPCADYDDRDVIREYAGRIKALTRVACELAKAYKETTKYPSVYTRRPLSAETEEWIRSHEAEDEARIKREARERTDNIKKKRALGKLTLEEKRLLGLR